MAETIRIPLGKDARLYYVKGGTGKPDVLEQTDFTETNYFVGVKDLTVTLDKEAADVRRRRTGDWYDYREAHKDLSLAFDVQVVSVDDCSGQQNELTQIEILRELYADGTYDNEVAIALWACSDPIAGGAGPAADFIITKFDRAETLGEGQVYSVEAKVTLMHCRIPSWITYSSWT